MHDKRVDLAEGFRDTVREEFGANAGALSIFLDPPNVEGIYGSATMMVNKIAFKANDLEGIVRETVDRLHLQAGLIETDRNAEYAYAELDGDFSMLWVTNGIGNNIDLMVTIRV